MAEADGQVKIIIDTNAESAAAELNKVQNAFNKTGSSAQNVSSVFNSLQNSVNHNIEALREIALAGGKNSETFKRLAAETREYNKMLDDASKTVENATNGFQKQSSPVDSLVSNLKNLAIAYVGIKGAVAAFNYTAQSVQAFRTQERAVQSLELTFQNAGVYSEEFSKKIQNLATSIQKYSNYGDETIIKAVALGQSFMGQVPITEQATKAVVDFAAAMGMDLEQAFTLFGKSVGSSTNALGRYGVELQKGMTDTQKMNAIAKQLTERYAGQAAQMSDSSVQLKNALGDLAEVIGKELNPVVEAAEKRLINLVNATAKNITVTSQWLSSEKSTLQELRKQWDMYWASRRKGQGMVFAVNEDWVKKQRESGIFATSQTAPKTAQKQNVKPIKITDDYDFSAGTATTQKAVEQVKNAFEKAQIAAQQAEKDFKLALYQYGEGSQQVDKARIKWEQTKSAVDKVENAFKNLTSTVEAKSISSFEELNKKIQDSQKLIQDLASADVVNIEQIKDARDELKRLQDKLSQVQSVTITSPYQQAQNRASMLQSQLLDMGMMGQGGTQQYNLIKNQYIQLQTAIQQANTQMNSQIGLSWTNTANSIKSQLSSALLTPLQEGETAMERLQNVAFSIFQSIGQEILQNLVFDKAISGIQSFIMKGQQGQNIFDNFSSILSNTSTSATSMAGAMSMLGTSQSVASAVIAATSSTIAASAVPYEVAGKAAAQLAASLSQVAIATAAKTAAEIPYIGWMLAGPAATMTGAGIAAGTMLTTGASRLNGKFADGGVFDNGRVTAFANGGVVSQPTYFPMAGGKVGLMGEAGAEAILPLKRDANGQLGVQAKAQPSVVNVYNYSDSRIESVKRPNGETDLFIRRVNNALASERTQYGMQRALSRNSNRGLQAS